MKQYLVIDEKSGNGWGAYVRIFPGSPSSEKRWTRSNKLIREGMALHLDGMRPQGEPIPEPTSLAEQVEAGWISRPDRPDGI